MMKLIPAALIAMFLVGCGSSTHLASPTLKNGAASAQSQAGVNRGIRGQFTYLFESLDADSDTFLSKDEMWGGSFQANTGVPADPAAASQNKAANMGTLDTNRDGKVTAKEFQNPGIVKAAATLYRYEIGKTFATLDLNGDRMLTAEEMGTKLTITFEEADLNHNEKVTLSELEDAVAEYSALGGGRREPATPPQPGTEPGGEG
jgi:hypothetical protein